MTCREYLRRRRSFTHPGADSWPQDLTEHLSGCRDCARLEDCLGSIEPEDIDLREVEGRVERLISKDLTPVTPLPPARQRTIRFALLSIVVVAVIVRGMGAHGWERMSFVQAYVTLGILAVMLLLAVSGISAQMVPGARQKVSPLWLFALCLSSLPLLGLLLYPFPHDSRFAFNALRCWAIGTACALSVVPFLWFFLRRGFPLAPPLHFATAGLLAGINGLAVLELHCPIMDGLHKAVGHGAVALTAALAGWAIASTMKQVLSARETSKP